MAVNYIVKKVLTLIITVLAITILTFVTFTVIPGDAAVAKAGVDASDEQLEALREEMGLNDSIWTRYTRWIGGALKGDFGYSYQYNNVTVSYLIKTRLPVTLMLAGLSLLLIIVFSIPLSLLAVKFRGGWIDHVISGANQVAMAIPSFFMGILITFVFGLVLKWFQPGNFPSPSENFWGSVGYLMFPALTVAIPKIAMTVKFLRSSIEKETKEDYVRTAKSKGNDEQRILYVHVLRAALIPDITFIALVLAEIMAGSIVAEQVFTLNGIGRLLITSISARDYPVVEAIVVYLTSVVVVINTLVDILYQLIDPRVRVS